MELELRGVIEQEQSYTQFRKTSGADESYRLVELQEHELSLLHF